MGGSTKSQGVFLLKVLKNAANSGHFVEFLGKAPDYGDLCSLEMRLDRDNRKATKARGELALIEQIRRRARLRGSSDVRLGIGDDCALLRLKAGEELAVTTDLSIEGRHFWLDAHLPQSVGHRTLARGLSDLAAMGARPVAAFLSLGLPRELTVARGRRPAWVDGFLDGLMTLAEAADVTLAGGDLAQSPLAVADIVLTGAVPRGKALLRSGAKAGDALYVTGALGGAAAGLERLGKKRTDIAMYPGPQVQGTGGTRDFRVPRTRTWGTRIPKEDLAGMAAHLYPQPRVGQGLWLRKRGLATACIDLSDGLSTDLMHLCAESGVHAEVDAEEIPVHAGATLEQALHGGEDYELLFTARDAARIPGAIAGVAVTRIGRIMQRRGGRPTVRLVKCGQTVQLPARGWEHFD